MKTKTLYNLTIIFFGVLVLHMLLMLSSFASSALKGVKSFGPSHLKFYGPAELEESVLTEPQISEGAYMPTWGPEDEGFRGNMDTRLWPESSIRFVELRTVEQALKDDEFETPEDRIRFTEAYEAMLCVASSDGFVMPPPTEEAEPAVDSTILIHVELRKRTLTVKDGEEVLRVFTGIESSRRGTGDGYNSLKTPLGEFSITKEEKHRYGPVLRLSGYQGWTRGILIHQDNTRDSGSNGCIHLRNLKEMNELFAMVPSGAMLKIEK